MQGVRRAEVQLGETACVIGLGLVGQLVVRLLVAAGVRVVGFDTVEERCRLAEKAGALLCAAPDEDGIATWSGPRSRHRRARRGPRLPRRRRQSNGPVETGREAGPRPRPRGRHRQDQARPAVERLLREGARRPLLAVLRPRPVRRPLRARGHRLPGGLRPLDRAPQPRVLPRPDRRATRSTSGPWCPGRSRSTTRPSVYAAARRRGAHRSRLPPRVPAMRSAAGQASAAARTRRARRPLRARPDRSRRLGFIGAGNYARSMLLPHLPRTSVAAWRTSRRHGRCRRPTRNGSSGSRRARPTPRRC